MQYTTEKEQYLSKIAGAQTEIKATVSVGYFDDDIIMIDNVRLLSEPSPTRLNMNAIAICSRGRVSLEVNGVPTLLQANQVLICPPNTVFSNMMLSPDFEFRAIFLTDRILHSFLRETMNTWTQVLYVNRMHVTTIKPQAVEFLGLFYRMLNISISQTDKNPYSTDVVHSLLRAAILGMCGEMELMVQDGPTASGDSLFQHFLQLLNSRPSRHRSVQSYADDLCVTPKYLSAVCKKNSGKTARQWISEHIIEDIRYYLRQTDLSIKQVSSQLGFPNTSFFGKYVKEHFGMTPTQLRLPQALTD